MLYAAEATTAGSAARIASVALREPLSAIEPNNIVPIYGTIASNRSEPRKAEE